MSQELDTIRNAISKLMSASVVIEMLPEQPGHNGSILMIDDVESARICRDIREAVSVIESLVSTPCKGENCGSADGITHSAECYAEHERTISATQPAQAAQSMAPSIHEMNYRAAMTAVESLRAENAALKAQAAQGGPVAKDRDCPHCNYTGSMHCGDVAEKYKAAGDPKDCSHAKLFGLRSSATQPAVAQGAGEVVADEFFAYHPEMGVEFFKTQREAVACTRENLDYEREGAIDQGEWDDSAAERTCWGVVVQRAKAVQSGMSDEGVAQFDYVLADTQPADGADVLDAKRYRMVRRGQHWSVINGIGDTLRGEDLDAAIDAVSVGQR